MTSEYFTQIFLFPHFDYSKVTWIIKHLMCNQNTLKPKKLLKLFQLNMATWKWK